MRKTVLAVSASLVVLVGCGGTGSPPSLPNHADQGLYVVCSGKPRWCAVADLRAPHPEWLSAEELSPGQTRRYERLTGRLPP